MAQPPGSDTRASPQRATSGPSTRIDARIVFTRSYGAVGSERRAARSDSPSLSSSDTSTPICESSLTMVLTSRRCGTFESVTSSSVSSAAHMSGSAAFFAPETRISPDRGTPPWMMSLSTRRFLRGERAHRQRVDLLAHALAERGVDELVALDAALAAKRLADDERLEMLAVACDAHLAARQSLLDVAADVLGGHHASASACIRSSAAQASAPRPRRETPRPPRGSAADPRPTRRRSRNGSRRSCRRRG